MFFTGRSKHLPYLSDYVEHAVRQKQRDASPAGALVGFLLVLGGIVAALGVVLTLPLLLRVAVLIGAISLVLAFSNVRIFKKKSPLTAADRLREEAADVANTFHASIQRRKLHKDLHPAAGELLELAAWQWHRCRTLLEGPYWNQEDLPSHWLALRNQTQFAIEQAMNEVIVLLRDAHQFSPQKGMLEEVVEEVFEEWRGRKREAVSRYPVAYEPARAIVEKMQKLVNEFEKATEDLAREEATSDQFSSSQAMDMCLSELRTIRHAEDELRENLHGGA